MGFDVDVRSLGLGFSGGVLTTLAIQRGWRYLQRFREDDDTALQGRATLAVQTGHRRYSRELIQKCQQHHLYGHRIALTELLVEPRFLRPTSLESLQQEETEIDIYADIPIIHDQPYLYAPYNIPSMRVRDLGRGENTLVIVGKKGSGRTTALYAIALYSLGQIDFASPRDSVQEQIEGELESMEKEQRAQRMQERARLSQLSNMRLAEDAGLTPGEIENLEKQTAPALQSRAPLLVDAFNLELVNFQRGATDPAEPLMRALQFGTGGLTRRTMPRTIYRLLNEGSALVLIDNLDNLPAEKHQQVLQWLRAFSAQYHQNRIIVTYDTQGYKPLIEMGYAPVYLRAWHDQQRKDAIDHVAQNWQILTESPNAPRDSQIETAYTSTRAHNPSELLMKLRGLFAGVEDKLGVYTGDYVAQMIGRDPAWQVFLARIAQQQLQHGIIRMVDLLHLAEEKPITLPQDVTGKKTATTDVDATAMTEVGDDNQQTITPSEEEKEEDSQQRRLARDYQQLLKQLVKNGLLKNVASGYRFNSHFIASYCASASLENEYDLVQVAPQPAWFQAIAFAGEKMPIDRAVAHFIEQPLDFGHHALLKVTHWLSYVGENATWRQHYLRLLGNLILAPQQYHTLRERCLAALVGSRDLGAIIILQRAFQHADVSLKKTASLALGAVENASAVMPITEMLAHEDINAQVCAALALSAMRNEDALDVVAEALQISANEHVRRAIAESLAGDRELGYLTLHEAIQAQEMLLRRAAVFGLGRVETDWARLTVHERYQLDDEEYYVQSAAEVVFINIFRNEKVGIRAYPQAGAIPWVMAWGHELVQSGRIDDDIDAIQLLRMAMTYHDDPDVQFKAIKTVGYIGLTPALKALYSTLFERQAQLRNAGYEALAHIEAQLGQRLPRPAWQ
jgi:HEAT repeat protein